MEKQERNKLSIRIFSFLMEQCITSHFSFPGGHVSMQCVSTGLDRIEAWGCTQLGYEKLIDYCICQVYAISHFEKEYLLKWKASHSFGKKAIERFQNSTPQKRYFEDRWLERYALSRNSLLWYFRDQKEHPLFKFIYPQYEERTKGRLYNKETGYLICQLSTLLYTPFSRYCRGCLYAARCIEVTKKKYPELYRIRMEAFNNTESHESQRT